MYKRAVYLFIVFTISLCLFGCGKNETVQTADSFFAMDTVMTIEANGAKSKEAIEEIKKMIFYIEALLSNKDENSELSRLNKEKSLKVSEDLLELAKVSVEYAKLTDGALDITTYDASRAWGFLDGNYRILDSEELNSLVKTIDYRNIKIDKDTISLGKDTSIWFGAVAKGYCSQKAVQILKKYGINSALINLGGNVVCIGQPLDDSGWNIGVEDPANIGSALGVIKVNDMAVVSSGNYQRFFEKDGKIYHHILDPKTAAPADVDIDMVSIVTNDATRADCLSTALYVMGMDKAIDFYHRSGQDFGLVIAKDNRLFISSNLRDKFTPIGSSDYSFFD